MNKRKLEKEAILTAKRIIDDHAETYIIGSAVGRCPETGDRIPTTPEQDYILKVLNNLKIQIRRK
jgi:hypothetical protein